MERTEEQNPARLRPYEVTRQYKVFRGDDPMPSSEVTAQIKFTPPDIKTFIITQEQGNPRGEKFVSVVDPIFWTEKRLFLRWWAALKIDGESMPKTLRVTRPA